MIQERFFFLAKIAIILWLSILKATAVFWLTIQGVVRAMFLTESSPLSIKIVVIPRIKVILSLKSKLLRNQILWNLFQNWNAPSSPTIRVTNHRDSNRYIAWNVGCAHSICALNFVGVVDFRNFAYLQIWFTSEWAVERFVCQAESLPINNQYHQWWFTIMWKIHTMEDFPENCDRTPPNLPTFYMKLELWNLQDLHS